LLCKLDIGSLRRLVSANQEQDGLRTIVSKIDPISRTVMYPQFENALACRFAIAGIAQRQTVDSGVYDQLRRRIR
jgi:hypothetical protein